MFKLESYVTTILLGYIDKYVKDFKPSDAQVSLWGGGVALNNLVLKTDILQQEVHLPFIISSGRIHELLIQVPWTKIMSEPIIVTMDTIECVFAYDPNASNDEELQPQRSRSQLLESPPGYMQALVRRIIMNISLRVHHLIIKYVHNSTILSLNVKHLSVDSAGTNWEPTFTDIDKKMPAIRKLVILDDLTVCLDHSDSDGKIRFYHEPLLYRCRIEIRFITRLMSVTTGHANSVSIQFRSTKLALGITTSQLHLLLQILRAHKRDVKEPPAPPVSKIASVTVTEPTSPHTTSADCEGLEPTVGWYRKAWSWLPSWTIHQYDVDETSFNLAAPVTRIPIYINVYSDEISLVFKVIETEGCSRKRTRGVLAFSASYAAVKCYVLTLPTFVSIRAGAHDMILKSQGNCICGQMNINAEPTIYLSGMQTKNDGEWKWPDDDIEDIKEIIVASDKECNQPETKSDTNCLVEEQNEASGSKEGSTHDRIDRNVKTDSFWQKMKPLIYMEYTQDKSPEPNKSLDSSRSYLQCNNWQEECQLNVRLRAIRLQLSVGLIHRISALKRILNEYQTLHKEKHLHTLTLEECEAIHENTPQRRINIAVQDFRLCVHPWDHSVAEKSLKIPLVLKVDIPKATILVSMPLDSYKVCLAAIKIKEETDALWQASRLHVSADFESIEVKICSPSDKHSKSFARANVRIVTHFLLNREILKRTESVIFSYSAKISDATISGSLSRLKAALQIPMSLLNDKLSIVLRYTTLAKDAMKDEGLVTLNITLEELATRGYLTSNVNTNIVTLQTCRVTASRTTEGGAHAWIFSAPDVPSTVPYLRAAVQWCHETSPTNLDYIGVWTEPTAFCMDPLLIEWLAYKPQLESLTDSHLKVPLSRTKLSSQHLAGRPHIATSPTSEENVSGSDSETRLPHSVKSSTNLYKEPSQHQDQSKMGKTKDDMLKTGKGLLKLYERLQHMLITVELGLMLVYVTLSTVSAKDCATVRRAMEQHIVTSSQRVLALSVGRWYMYSSTLSKKLWQDIKHDGPTFITDKAHSAIEYFPWKIRFADMSCYTMETHTGRFSGREKATGLRSQLKTSHIIQLRSILELVTTSLNIYMVTKCRRYRTFLRKPSRNISKQNESDKNEDKTKYFTSGTSFKPTTLKEFVRGPERRKKARVDPPQVPDETDRSSDSEPDQKITDGPVVAVGIKLYAETPPLIVRLDQDQVYMVGATIHCFVHVLTLCQQGPFVMPKQDQFSFHSVGASKSMTRSHREIDARTKNECKSELIPIFQAQPDQERESNIIRFLWFRWTIGNVTVTVSADEVKLVFDIENIVSSVDVQEHYNQLKVDITSASLKYFKRTESNDWIPGVLDGRVIEPREITTGRENQHLLAVTITQAQISDLPPSWKEELNPKLFEQPDTIDSMWEIYASIAPLEVALQPSVFEKIISVAFEMAPRSSCPLKTEIKSSNSTWQWPYCYVNSGGLRLIIACDNQDTDIETNDDTFTIACDRISVNPHPENPLCRHLVNSWSENVARGLEGRQYEILVFNITIKSTQLQRIIYEEESEPNIMLKVGGELPTHRISETVSLEVFTPVISLLDVSCVLAPALFVEGILTCAPGVQLNVMSNCVIELNIEQLVLIRQIHMEMSHAFRKRQYSCTDFSENNSGVCPYATLLMNQGREADVSKSDISGSREDSKVNPVASRLWANDVPLAARETSSVGYLDVEANPKECIEVFITLGTVEVSLYAVDDNSPEIIALRPKENVSSDPEENNKKNSTELGAKLHLLHVMLQQPNLYYVHKKTHKNIQVSLFNAWVSLNALDPETSWHSVLMCTAQGVIDPVTEIPPALATIKVSAPVAGRSCIDANDHGTINFEIERPVLFEICANRLRRIKGIFEILQRKLSSQSSTIGEFEKIPLLYLVRLFMVKNPIKTVTIRTSQMGLNGYAGSLGWDSASLQLAWDPLQDRVVARSLLSAALVSAGTPQDSRQPVLQPLQVGFELNATWDAWRQADGSTSREPTVGLRIDLDRMIIDVRPDDLSALNRIQQTLITLFGKRKLCPSVHSNSSGSTITQRHDSSHCMSSTSIETHTSVSLFETVDLDHYYKDDLRSSAFKIVKGNHLPMAYEIVLHSEVVSWAYPHPRGIAKLIAFPLKDHNKEVKCILEMYNQILKQWEPHTYFNIPVDKPNEMQLYVPSPEAAFATMWRFRTNIDHKTNYKFCMANFVPKQEPLISDLQPEPETDIAGNTGITAMELLNALHVDSFFAPQLIPSFSLSLQLAGFELHVHNSMPSNTSQATPLEGYYVSKPLMRSHRVLTMNARGTTMHTELGSPGILILINTKFSNDILDCASGTMEPLINDFTMQMAVSLKYNTIANPRIRFSISRVHLAIDVPRLRTLSALAEDWKPILKQFESESSECQSKLLSKVESDDEKIRGKQELADVIMGALEGRVSLWLRNGCVCALRVGQEGTEEVLPMESGTRLAYRWRNPSAMRKLRFAFANPSADWQWSSSIPFSTGSYRVRLEDKDCVGGKCDIVGSEMFLYVDVKQTGSIRCMHLSGRLQLANILRFGLLYKVRLHLTESKTWRTVSSGELKTECVGRSVVCGSGCEMVLKIKNMNHKYGWSGDIPLKECPKENIPWLVKVPNGGDVPYVSVWCRVVRSRSDGRILASIWPLYILHSHLPLDTDVLIATEVERSSTDLLVENVRSPPTVQTASGRGMCTHLLAPGTTLDKHSLSFQYRDIECAVTREAVPLHYGVTDTSVFDNSPAVYNIDEVLQEVTAWLDRSRIGTETSWPYSLVTKHWRGVWQPANLQPRCDVTIRYHAVRAGGACSLEVRLSPVVLMCNASPVALTLRSHDASPLCKLESGAAIAPSTAVITKPFFMSVESGRETFISSCLEVCTENLKSYDSKSTAQVARDHPSTFAIQCNQKMALFTMYYEVKNDIKIIGVTSTYSLINMLDTNILVSAIAVAGDDKKDVLLHPKTFKVLQPTKGKCQGAPLCRFWLRERWRGGDPARLHIFLCLALPAGASAFPAHAPAPVRLGRPPVRRALGLIDCNKKSIAVVITQHKEDSRCYITISPDTCPQFLVHNQTCHSLAIAQSMIQYNDEASASDIMAVADCAGARWWNVVEPDSVLHYSTPAYCTRSSSSPEAHVVEPLLTFSRIIDDSEPDWSAPVAATDGERVVQLCRGLAVTMRVRTHPHSSLIELLDVEQVRLKGTRPRMDEEETEEEASTITSDRVCAEVKLRERMRSVIAAVTVVMLAADDTCPLIALHMDHISLHVSSHATKTMMTLSIKDMQVDNGQYENDQFAFAVVATTQPDLVELDRWPAISLRNMFSPQDRFTTHQEDPRVLINIFLDKWTVVTYSFIELTEVDIRIGPLALYLEESFVRALLELFRLVVPPAVKPYAVQTPNRGLSLKRPLCFRRLHIYPVDLNLTLHTARHVYIALDHSSLQLKSFIMKNMMMSMENLTHELKVHYLSAAILGAGWVVGGLELLGAPGALVARVLSSPGGVSDKTSATAAALMRSLSSWAESVAFNLALLAGEESHVMRHRSRAPNTFMAGVITRIANLAVNLLESVGALSHHPFIGDTVVDVDHSVTALRRGLLGALTKPLSATAELVAFAGNELLKQIGFNPIPQPRPVSSWGQLEIEPACWRRNCVRWTFRLAEMTLLAGFEVLLNNAHLQLLLTHKFVVVADPESERVVEMIDLRSCTLSPYQGTIIELYVSHRRLSKVAELRSADEDDEYQMSAAAMARTPLLDGENSPCGARARVLLLPAPGQSHALHAALAAAIHYNSDTYFALL